MLAELVLITNIAFNVCYDAEKMVPNWVQYDLEPHEAVRMKRLPLPFHADPRVTGTDLDRHYVGSGYDRGHMAPAADFNFDLNALYETYAFSNTAPQLPELNRGPWLDAENEVRTLAASGTVHIIMFPLFSPDVAPRRVGPSVVPDTFIKVAWGWFGVRVWFLSNLTKKTAPAK